MFNQSRSTYISVPPFPLAHRDLKPGNILIDLEDGKLRARITDFGSINPIFNFHTMGFSSPEKMAYQEESSISFNERYGRAADIWSLGLICIFILNQTPPDESYFTPLPSIQRLWNVHIQLFKGDNLNKADLSKMESQIFSQITQKIIDFDLNEFVSQSPPELIPLWNLVKRMLQIRPETRITAKEALELIQSYTETT